MLKKLVGSLLGLLIIGGGIFLYIAYYPELPPKSDDQKPQASADKIEHGRLVAAAGYCVHCHTVENGEPFAGNYPMATGFGTIYSTNITPDMETGIGKWSEEAFHRAMKRGVDREGRHLFPAFPYDHFTKMTDEDISAVYAYLMNEVKPVKQDNSSNSLPFPLNIRILQAGWKFLFVDFGTYEPDPDKSDEWNRGAYLAEGDAHCSSCHTPRNMLGAEKKSEAYAGASLDNWIAPPLTQANPSAVPWVASSLFEYLKTGVSTYHGVSAGPMGPVVHGGIRELPDSDIKAISLYIADKIGAPEEDPTKLAAVQASLAANKPDRSYRYKQGERLYATACAACHYNTKEVLPARPDLGINSATRLERPDNLIQVILHGINAPNGIKGVVMPAFHSALDDEEIAAIVEYLRTNRADLKPWKDLVKDVANLREADKKEEAVLRSSK